MRQCTRPALILLLAFFATPALAQEPTGLLKKIKETDPDKRLSGDVYVLNNTAIEHRTFGAFLKLYGPAWADSVTVKNNLWINASFMAGNNGSSAIYASEDNLRSFKEITGNVWATPKTYARWAAGGGSNYVGATWGQQGAYKTNAQWNDDAKVGTDYFTNDVTLNGVYQVVLAGTTAGSTLRIES